MLSHLFSVGILPFAISVLCVKIIFLSRRGEWRWHSFRHQGLPVESLEPIVLLEDVRALLSQTITRLALDKPIDEVCGLDGPLLWDLALVDLDLF